MSSSPLNVGSETVQVSIEGRGAETVFVLRDVPATLAETLAALGFAVADRTATRHVDEFSRHVRGAFGNLAARLEAMVDQHLGRRAVPWQESFERLCSKLDRSGVDWAVIGTTALAIRGVEIIPGDIDLVTDEGGALELAELYSEDLVFPVVAWPGSGLFGRAFDGSRIEWLGNDGSLPGAWSLAAASEAARWRAYSVRVPPVEVQLQIEVSRGRQDRASAIRRFLEEESR